MGILTGLKLGFILGDFGMTPPHVGFTTVGSKPTIEFQLNLTKSA